MSLLDELMVRVGAMPDDDRQTLVKEVMAATADMRFVPLPGPQTEAYYSQADILLYGGQASGGKSFLLMGLASQEHKRSIIFRREGSQTDGLEEAGKSIIGDSANFNGTDKEWKWPDGRSLKLAGMQLPDDWGKHAGRERDLYCVAAGTNVVMGDGSLRAIEDLSFGDLVATLEGPRSVVRVLPVQRKPCVKVYARGAWQVQSQDHPIMTSQGWLSAGVLTDERQSTLGRVCGSISQLFFRTYGVLWSKASQFYFGLSHKAGCALKFQRIQRDLALREASLQLGGGSDSVLCYDRNQEPYPPLSAFSRLKLWQQYLQLVGLSVALPALLRVVSRVLAW